MADYDSDSSSGSNDIETNVLLGYASKEETSDEFSQLGGQPIWFSPSSTPPSSALGNCKICNGTCSLLLQLNADLVERFPGHERRMYVVGCRRKACRRKEGSVRAFRGVRIGETVAKMKKENAGTNGSQRQQRQNLGEALFGAKSPTPAQANANPFAASPSAGGQNANPFAAAKPATTDSSSSTTPSAADDLPQTFAQKARISSPPPPPSSSELEPPSGPWQTDPSPYPSYYLDADKEYLEAEPESIPSNARLDNSSEGGSGSAADDKAAFESSMDKTFQRFADRLSQNPEQVLRYEFGGQPLLYSKDDKVGRLLAPPDANAAVRVQTASSASISGSKMPRCANCGAARVFEMQLTPHAITELEAEDMSVDGMDWGTIIVGSCVEDCQQKGKAVGEVGYVEEWVGVQWEEMADGKRK